MLRTTPDHAVEFAQMLLSDDAEPLANINQVCDQYFKQFFKSFY